MQPEPRWPALVAIVAVGALNVALPDWVSVGPRGLMMAISLALLVPLYLSHRLGHHHLNRKLGYLNDSFLTAALLASVVYLVRGMSAHKQAPEDLLIAAASLWVSNILVFSLWYWHLDAGGPNHRERREGHPDGAFLFPQMTIQNDKEMEKWSPGFIDYLFLSFNTSTAFSPTDCPVLDGWAKGLMMIQSLISLTVVALLIARAINTL